MATIRKGKGKWHVQVRRAGCPSRTRTFHRKENARQWARQAEADADRQGLPLDRKRLRNLTVGDLLTRYRDAVTPKKRGRAVEAYVIGALLRRPIAKVTLDKLAPAHFAAFRDDRRTLASVATVRRELALLQHAIQVARRDWNLGLPENPVAKIEKPTAPKTRERRLEGDEWARLMAACKRCRNERIEPLIRLAVETGMRRSELVNIHQGA